jgi:hypothetical protein
MLPYEFYKLLHHFGLFMLMIAFGGSTIYMMSGGKRETFPHRRLVALSHGIGLFLILITGFGLLAKLYPGQSFPGWVYPKMVIWLAFGLIPVAIYRISHLAKLLLLAIVVLASTAAFLAVYKPF